MAFDTVMPAISQPQPNTVKPRAASLALPGISTHHDDSHCSKGVPSNHELMAYSLIHAPANISEAESVPVKRTPILSSMMPAKMRKPNTLSIYSAPA